MKNKFTLKFLLSLAFLLIIQINMQAQTINAGIDQSLCIDVATLAAADPTAGWYGVWSVNAGFGAIADVSNRNTLVNSLALGNNIFRWSVYTSAGTFVNSDDVTITNNLKIANAGADITICTNNTMLNGSNPSPGTGMWSVQSGGGAFGNTAMYNSTVSSIPLGVSTYRWTIMHLGCNSSDDVNVTNDAVYANAGMDANICGSTTSLSGNNPGIGSGNWNVVTGTGSFAAPNLYNTTVSAIDPGTSTFRWMVTNGTCVASDNVSITNLNIPAHAGGDFAICNSYGIVNGNNPSPGTGNWSDPNSIGIIFGNNAAESTAIWNLSTGANVLRWNITNAGCNTFDEVIVTNDSVGMVNAGPDQELCLANGTLTGNSITVGEMGKWTILKGKATISENTMNSTLFNNLGLGINEFRWSIKKGLCMAYDDVIIENLSPYVNAGDDKAVYEVSESTLNGNMPAGGAVGVWSVALGTGSFGNASEPTTLVTGLSNDENIFTWTITPSSGLCMGTQYHDDVLITVGSITRIEETTDWIIPPSVTEYDKIEVYAPFTINVPVNISEIYLGAGAKMSIGGIGKAAGSLTVKGLTIEPDPSKSNKAAVASLRIGQGGSLTIEPDPSKKGFMSSINAGGTLTIEPDPSRKGAQFTLTTGSGFTVNAGGTLTIEPDPSKNSKAANTITIENGAHLVLEEGAKFINLSASPAVVGNIDYNFIFPYNTWNFFSSPVQTANVNFFRGAYMYSYNENKNEWINLVLNDPLVPLHGTILKYLPEIKAGKEVFFTGNPNGGTTTRNLDLTGDPINFGYNLIGNPYSAPIFWNQPLGFNKTNTTGTIYKWNGVIYSTHNGTIGVPGGTSPVIDLSEAFFVQATTNGGVFQVFPGAQTQPTKKQLPKQPTDIIRLKVTNNEWNDEMAIYLDSKASINYDLGIDANKFMESQDNAENGIFYPQIYSITPENNLLTIDAVHFENANNISIPIGININTPADLKLTAFGFEQFDTNVSILLEDKTNNSLQNLRENPLLSIKVAQGKTENRFVLHFSKSTTDLENLTSSTVSAFAYQKTIYINLENENNAKVEVFDILGKKLLNQKIESSGQTSIQTELPSGNYILKISNNNIQHSQKILIK